MIMCDHTSFIAQAGADFDYLNPKTGCSPVHHAAFAADSRTFEILIDYAGTDVSAICTPKTSPSSNKEAHPVLILLSHLISCDDIRKLTKDELSDGRDRLWHVSRSLVLLLEAFALTDSDVNMVNVVSKKADEDVVKGSKLIEETVIRFPL